MDDQEMFMRNLENLEQFTEVLVNAIERIAEEQQRQITVRQLETNKVNENAKPAITITNKDSCIGVTQYPGDIYEAFKDTDRTVSDIAKEVMIRAEIANRQLPSFDLSQINAETAREHLYLQVVNAEQNQKLIENCANIKINDLVAIPRWRLAVGDESASCVVSHELQANYLHLTDSELLKIARENTAKDYELKGLSQVMREMMGADMPPEMVDMMMPDGPEMMYVLNAADKSYGASAIVSTDTLREVQEKLGEDFYIIPSSRFEVLCVPQSTVADPADLKIMCEEVNSTEVKPDEKLSDNIYRFDGQKLTICNSLADLRQQQGMKDTAKATVEHKVKM